MLTKNTEKLQNIHYYDSLLELTGNTPLVSLERIASQIEGHFFAKLEAFNPGHSAKDRTALYIITEAEKQGLLKPGGVIIETTSGNTGFSLAMIAAIRGYRCILAVTDKSSQDKIDMLRALGAEVHVCPAKVAPEDPRSYYLYQPVFQPFKYRSSLPKYRKRNLGTDFRRGYTRSGL